MDAEKIAWLEESGIKELKEPFAFMACLGDSAVPSQMLYSRKYLEETPLEKLKAAYEKAFQRKSCKDCERHEALLKWAENSRLGKAPQDSGGNARNTSN